jgi:hypothetical protein
MIRGMLKALAVSTAALAITALGGTSAQASSHTGWEPVGPGDPVAVEACGTTLTITEKVNKVESRTREDREGNVRTDYRGTYIVKVTAPDGRKVVLDNSGPYSVYSYANGDTYVPVRAPALIYPFDPAESAAFRRAGLPEVFYFTRGRLELFIRADGRAKVLTKPKNPVSICTLLR